MDKQMTRRATLSLAGGLAVGGIGLAATTAAADTTEETFTIMEGTPHETTGYVRTADADGPTVMIVGGMHGSEQAGYEAAAALTDMAIDQGQLVVVPRANAEAIENNSRTGDDGVDLNRQFPVGAEPQTELARALWGVVEEYEPDEFVDLHESVGIYDGEDISSGVGQAIFHTRNSDARQEAAEVADYMNENHVDDDQFNFTIGPFSAEDGNLDGLFTHKVTRDTNARAFLVETYSIEPELEQRIEWLTTVTQRLTSDELDGSLGAPTPTPTDEATPTETDEPTPTETEEPTPTETEEPTPTETEEPTPTETEEPTETEQPTETEEPTATEEPTETAEPTQTEEPTETPTETDTPTETETPIETETPTETPEPNEAPVAEITTDPADAGQIDFTQGDTVVLDASPSSDPDGEIASYKWSANGTHGFEASGESVEVTLDFCGKLPVGLQVTDEDGATTTTEIVLATAR